MRAAPAAVLAAVALTVLAAAIPSAIGGPENELPRLPDPVVASVDGGSPDGSHVVWHPGGPGILERSTFERSIPAELLEDSSQVSAVIEPWAQILDMWPDTACHDQLSTWISSQFLDAGGLASVTNEDWTACSLGSGTWGYGPEAYADAVEGFVADGTLPEDYAFVGSSFGATMAGELERSTAPPASISLISPVPLETSLQDLLRDRVNRTAEVMDQADPTRRGIEIGGQLASVMRSEGSELPSRAATVDVTLGWQAAGVSEPAVEAARQSLADGTGRQLRRMGQGARFAIGDDDVDVALVGYLDAMCATWRFTIDRGEDFGEALLGLHVPCASAKDDRTRPASPQRVDCVVVAADDPVTGGHVPDGAVEVVEVDGGHGTYASCDST